MKRREFLQASDAALASIGLPASSLASKTAAPMIYSDGIRDDTAGLSALLSGRPFQVHPDAQGFFMIRNGIAYILDGRLHISESIIPKIDWRIHNCHFDWVLTDDSKTYGFIDLCERAYGTMSFCTAEYRNERTKKDPWWTPA